MVRVDAADKARAHIEEAVQKARARPDRSGGISALSRGHAYLAPQTLINVDHGMRVMTEETFGPVVGTHGGRQ